VPAIYVEPAVLRVFCLEETLFFVFGEIMLNSR